MDSWPLHLPMAQDFSYVSDGGVVRTPFVTTHPRQFRKWDSLRRTFSLSFYLTHSELKTAKAFIQAKGFSWFSLPLLSGGAASPITSLIVRVVSDDSLEVVGHNLYKLSFQAEEKGPDSLNLPAQTFAALPDTPYYSVSGCNGCTGVFYLMKRASFFADVQDDPLNQVYGGAGWNSYMLPGGYSIDAVRVATFASATPVITMTTMIAYRESLLTLLSEKPIVRITSCPVYGKFFSSDGFLGRFVLRYNDTNEYPDSPNIQYVESQELAHYRFQLHATDVGASNYFFTGYTILSNDTFSQRMEVDDGLMMNVVISGLYYEGGARVGVGDVIGNDTSIYIRAQMRFSD